MPSQEKKEKVKQIKKWFEKSESLLLLRYTGLTVSEANELRGRLKGMESELRVMKNTLTRIALADTPNEGLSPMLEGPVAVVFVRQDPGQVARALREFVRGRKECHLLGGMVEGRTLDGKQVEAFAMLPPREVLLAQMLGALKSPLSSTVGVCAGVIRNMLGLFQAIADKAPAAPGGAPEQAEEKPEPGVAEAAEEPAEGGAQEQAEEKPEPGAAEAAEEPAEGGAQEQAEENQAPEGG